MSCEKCLHPDLGYNTGEIGQAGYLDCACGVADERAAFNELIKVAQQYRDVDLYWLAYQTGKAAALKQFTTTNQDKTK